MTNKNHNHYFVNSNIISKALVSIMNYIYGSLALDTFDDWIFKEIDIQKIALESAYINPETALHKVIWKIIYQELYLYTYDDFDGADSDLEFFDVILEIIKHTNIENKTIPAFFLLENPTEKDLKDKSKSENVNFYLTCLKNVRDQVFAHLWRRVSILRDFNLRLAEAINTTPLEIRIKKPGFNTSGLINRQYFPKWLKDIIEQRENGRCYHCGIPISYPDLPNKKVHLDHLIPLSKGGTNDPTNLVLSCPTCNTQKGAKMLPVKDKYSWPKI